MRCVIAIFYKRKAFSAHLHNLRVIAPKGAAPEHSPEN
jgi:hypothetical protein